VKDTTYERLLLGTLSVLGLLGFASLVVQSILLAVCIRILGVLS
jgi:hypothetical protein